MAELVEYPLHRSRRAGEPCTDALVTALSQRKNRALPLMATGDQVASSGPAAESSPSSRSNARKWMP